MVKRIVERMRNIEADRALESAGFCLITLGVYVFLGLAAALFVGGIILVGVSWSLKERSNKT